MTAKKKRSGGTPRTQQRPRPASTTAATTAAKDRSGIEAALAAEGVQAGSASGAAATPEGPVQQALLAAYRELTTQAEEYQRCVAAVEARRADADRQAEAAEQDRTAAVRELTEARTWRAKADEERAERGRRQGELDALAEVLAERERQADNGFAERDRAAVAALTAELRDRRIQFDQEYTTRESDLDRRGADIDRRERELTGLGTELRLRERALDDRADTIDAEIRAAAAQQVNAAQLALDTATAEAEPLRWEIDKLRSKVGEQARQLVALGHTDPADLMHQLEHTKTENQRLREQVAANLDNDGVQQLRMLEQRVYQLRGDRERLSYELERLRGIEQDNRLGNLRLKQLSDAERSFEVICVGYQARIDELNGHYQKLIQDRPDPTRPLFRRCVAVDDDPVYAQPAMLAAAEPDLAALATDLQSAMFKQKRLAYRRNDLCLLLGGLAMSRLHLLEGMSGIGKTSLPRALGEVLGWECEVIEVQAGWRDSTDLFGHHNTFERRFEESPFLQALYRAQTVRHRDQPFLIVLDEMNLSRPEQYFSVVLSKLENDDGEPIQLVTDPGARPPRLLPNGTSITFPDNVWFLGTANQDESTVEFADKTYSRAHVLELPSRRPWVASGVADVQPFGLHAMRTAFDQAGRRHRDELKKAQDFLAALADPLEEHARAFVGPRLDAQLTDFVPVVVAAKAGVEPDERRQYDDAGQDGTALAIDHFLATKVLRPLRGRYGVLVDDLRRLEEAVEEQWATHHLAGKPARIRRLLDDVLRQQGG